MPDVTALAELRHGSDWVSRRADANRVVSIAWSKISVGKHRSDHNVNIQIYREMVQNWDGTVSIKSSLRSRPKGLIRKKNASTTAKN